MTTVVILICWTVAAINFNEYFKPTIVYFSTKLQLKQVGTSLANFLIAKRRHVIWRKQNLKKKLKTTLDFRSSVGFAKLRARHITIIVMEVARLFCLNPFNQKLNVDARTDC